jgi:hypothetical protein
MRVPVGNNTSIQEIAAAVNELYDALQWQDPVNNRSLGQIEPSAQFLRTGQIAYADGSTWNPNSQGAGYYRYTGSAWVKFLEPDDTFTTSIDAGTVDTFHASQTPTASYLLAAGSDATMPIKPIFDYTVTGSAVTSVTTDGTVTLDANTHGGYFAEYIIYNPTAGNTTYRMYYNNDTTNTNYYTIRPGVANVNDAYLTFNGGVIGTLVTGFWNGVVQISPAGFVRSDLTFWETSFFGAEMCHHKIATVANLTRIDWVSSVASGIGINSRFRLWRRM